MKSEIGRENLKNNFLKNIIVRFDYSGIAEVELDPIIAEAKAIFKEDGYNRLKEEYLTELDFQLQDPERMSEEGLPVKEIRKKKAYVFFNDEKGIQCKISTQFAFVSIQSQKYIPFSEYSKTLISVMSLLRQEVEFLNFTRFGVRKVNQCILKDICCLNNYFELGFFNIYGLEKGNVPKLFENKDCFVEGKYNLNLARMVIMGEYDNADAYQVVLDADIYINEHEDINQVIEDADKVNEMNERLFELYKEAITESFIQQLGKDVFDDDNIIGVERNE